MKTGVVSWVDKKMMNSMLHVGQIQPRMRLLLHLMMLMLLSIWMKSKSSSLRQLSAGIVKLTSLSHQSSTGKMDGIPLTMMENGWRLISQLITDASLIFNVMQIIAALTIQINSTEDAFLNPLINNCKLLGQSHSPHLAHLFKLTMQSQRMPKTILHRVLSQKPRRH